MALGDRVNCLAEATTGGRNAGNTPGMEDKLSGNVVDAADEEVGGLGEKAGHVGRWVVPGHKEGVQRPVGR